MLLYCTQHCWWNSLNPGDRATWVLALFAFLALCANVWLLAQSRRLFTTLNTAWLDIDGEPYPKNYLDSGEHIAVAFKLKNFGSVVATDISLKVKLKLILAEKGILISGNGEFEAPEVSPIHFDYIVPGGSKEVILRLKDYSEPLFKSGNLIKFYGLMSYRDSSKNLKRHEITGECRNVKL
jgi:hypothetical protein